MAYNMHWYCRHLQSMSRSGINGTDILDHILYYSFEPFELMFAHKPTSETLSKCSSMFGQCPVCVTNFHPIQDFRAGSRRAPMARRHPRASVWDDNEAGEQRWRAGTGPSFASADARPIKTLYFVSLIYARFKLRPFKLHYIRALVAIFSGFQRLQWS